MYFYIIVLTFLVVVIYAYYIVFIVCLFPLSFYIKRKNKKEKLIAKNFASENKHKQKASRLHSNLGIWLNEYVRYAIYKTDIYLLIELETFYTVMFFMLH